MTATSFLLNLPAEKLLLLTLWSLYSFLLTLQTVSSTLLTLPVVVVEVLHLVGVWTSTNLGRVRKITEGTVPGWLEVAWLGPLGDLVK